MQFSKEDSDIVIQINISNRANKAGVLHVDVTDSGAGFESSAGARLFSPFIQLQQQKSEECDTEKNQHGFGLGLAIARDIVESSLNGRIFGKSAGLGQGACFGFDMPIELVDEEEQQGEEEGQKKNTKDIATEDCSETKCVAVSDERTSSKPLRIMCVDDSKVLEQEKKTKQIVFFLKIFGIRCSWQCWEDRWRKRVTKLERWLVLLYLFVCLFTLQIDL